MTEFFSDLSVLSERLKSSDSIAQINSADTSDSSDKPDSPDGNESPDEDDSSDFSEMIARIEALWDSLEEEDDREDESEPNCRVRLRGRHYYSDREFFINPYGMTFYDDIRAPRENPHIAASSRYEPSILDRYFEDPFMPPVPSAPIVPSRREMRILRHIGEKYIEKNKLSDRDVCELSCDCEGCIYERDGMTIVRYGVFEPSFLCFRTEDSFSANFAFSPISAVSFERGRRIAQTLRYSPPTDDPFDPPEGITVDFSVNTETLSHDITVQEGGKLVLRYSMIVGTTCCERTDLSIEVRKLDGT